MSVDTDHRAAQHSPTELYKTCSFTFKVVKTSPGLRRSTQITPALFENPHYNVI